MKPTQGLEKDNSGILTVRTTNAKIAEIRARCEKGKVSVNQWLTRAIDQQLRKR